MDIVIHIDIIGSINVGKKSLSMRRIYEAYTDSFNESMSISLGQDQTIIIDYYHKISINNTEYTLYKDIIYDIKKISHKSHGIILVFDLTRYSTYLEIVKIYQTIKTIVHKDAQFILVGTKFDQIVNDNIDNESQILNFASENSMKYIKTSVKNDYNIEEVYLQLTTQIIEKYGHQKIFNNSIIYEYEEKDDYEEKGRKYQAIYSRRKSFCNCF